MYGIFSGLVPVLAQGAAPAAGGNEGLLAPLMIFLPMLVVFYLLIIRPQQQQEKRRRLMVSALKKNDRVLTAAGIYGTVLSLDAQDDRMVLRTGDNTKLEVTRSSVMKVVQEAVEKSSESAS